MYLSKFLPVLLLPQAFAQLNTLAKAKGLLYFGSATDNPELTDATYVSILSNSSNFGQITPGNTQKWYAIEPSQNVFSYTGGDVIAALAKKNGQILRCHTLAWHSQLPNWVNTGTWTNATLTAVLQNHIKNEVTHYKGQCYAWDVVNEAFNEDGTYRVSPFSTTIGPEFIPIAFQTAALYDPDVKLYYNDYNIEYNSAKATATIALVKSLKARGIKIDGVGLQAHFIVGNTGSLSAQTAVLNAYTALDVDVAYTELDIRFTTLPPTAAGLERQATDYTNTVGACLAVKRCVGITIWDYTDKFSWIPSTFPGQGAACLWNADYTTKPAYASVISLLGGAIPTSTVTSTLVTSTVTSTSTATATPTGGAGTLPIYSKCGGIGWTGSGSCVAGTTCKYFNDYYSQCL